MIMFAQVGDFKNCNKALILKYACEGLYYMIECRNDESVLPPSIKRADLYRLFSINVDALNDQICND